MVLSKGPFFSDGADHFRHCDRPPGGRAAVPAGLCRHQLFDRRRQIAGRRQAAGKPRAGRAARPVAHRRRGGLRAVAGRGLCRWPHRFGHLRGVGPARPARRPRATRQDQPHRALRRAAARRQGRRHPAERRPPVQSRPHADRPAHRRPVAATERPGLARHAQKPSGLWRSARLGRAARRHRGLSRRRARRALRRRADHRHVGHAACPRSRRARPAAGRQRSLGRGSRLSPDPRGAGRRRCRDAAGAGRRAGHRRRGRHRRGAARAGGLHHALAPVPDRRRAVDGAPAGTDRLGERVGCLDRRGRLCQRVPLRRPAARRAAGPRCRRSARSMSARSTRRCFPACARATSSCPSGCCPAS